MKSFECDLLQRHFTIGDEEHHKDEIGRYGGKLSKKGRKQNARSHRDGQHIGFDQAKYHVCRIGVQLQSY